MQSYGLKDVFIFGNFKFNKLEGANLGLAQSMALKIYTIVEKGFKQNSENSGANFYICKSYRGKSGRGGLTPS